MLLRCAILSLSLFALWLMACGQGEPRLTTEGRAWVPLHPRSEEPALAALVFSEGMTLPGESESEDHPLAIAVWADGTLISSAAGDGAYGQPYRTANIGAEASETIHSRIRAVMLEREGKLGSFRIPDASSEELLVRDGDRVWRMQSCIDIFEANTSVVAFPGGIAARDQAPPRDANDPEERELREFREAWSRAKKLLLSAVPVAGDPLEAQDLKFRAIGSTPR